MGGISVIQFEDRDGKELSGILQVPNTISSAQLKGLINTKLDLFLNGKLISTTLESTLTREQLENTEEVKKIRLCEDLPTTQPALYCASSYSGHEGPVLAVKLSGPVLITSGGDKTVRFWDMITRTQKHIVSEHSHWVVCIDATPDMIVSGGMDKIVNVYDQAGKLLHKITRHRNGISALKIVGSRIISCGRDGTCIVSDPSGTILGSWTHRQPIKAMAATEDFVLTGDMAGCIKVYKSNKYLCDLKGHNDQINSIDISGRYVVSGDDSGLIIVWKDWKALCRLQHKREVISLNISPNGQSFASGSFDKTVKLWSIETGEVLANYFHAGPVYKVKAFNDLIISASRDRTIKAYRLSAKKLVSDLVAEDEVYDFDYNNGTLVCGCRNGKVQFFSN